MGHENEMWQEFDAQGERVMNGGRAPELGNAGAEEVVYTACSAVWVYRRVDGGTEVLFQKRSQKVDRNPGKWDISAGGHINYGESKVDAAVRECREEIGLMVTREDLEGVFSVRHDQGVHMRLFYYFCDLTGKEVEFNFDDEEVEEVAWVRLEDFDEFVKQNAKKNLRNDKYVLEIVKAWLAGEAI